MDKSAFDKSENKQVCSNNPSIRAVRYGPATAGHKDYQTNNLDNSIMALTAEQITAL